MVTGGKMEHRTTRLQKSSRLAQEIESSAARWRFHRSSIHAWLEASMSEGHELLLPSSFFPRDDQDIRGFPTLLRSPENGLDERVTFRRE